jgi:PKD repeat protein
MRHFFTKNLRRLSIAVLSAILFLPFKLSAQLSGSYTVDPSSSASSSNYKNIGSVVSDLMSGTRSDGGTANGKGVSGAVVVKIANGTYNEQISIGAIQGISSSYTVTFQSKSGDSSKVILTDTTSASSTNNYTLQLTGAKYVTIKQISILRTGTKANSVVMSIDNGSKYLQIIGCRLIGKLDPSTTTTSIAAGNPVILSTGVDSNDLFQGNRIKFGYNGFAFTGTSGGYKNTISGNIIDTSGMAGVYAPYYQSNMSITKNIFNEGIINISGVTHYLSYGVRLENASNFSITKNKFYATSNASVSRCIVLFYGSGSSSAHNLLANNFCWVSAGSTSSTGITLGGNSYLDIIYNNVLMTSTPSLSAALYVYTQYTGSNNVVKNNNLINKGTGYAIDDENVPSTSGYSTGLAVSNYNNLYTKGTYIGNYKSVNYKTLSDWQSGTSFDTNSLSVDPGYVSTTDLHVSNSAINNKGTSFSGISDDIDGDTRSSSTPDIGADEFTPSTKDIGVSALDTPGVYCAPYNVNVAVKISNYGTDTLKSATISWSVNGGTVTNYSWTGKLATGQTSGTIALGKYNFSSKNAYTVKVWTSSPNGSTDQKNTNDTLVKVVASGLSGTYTLGGSSPDFASFNDVLNTITLRGLCGATVIKVRDGTYSEQLSFPAFTSLSATNTLTFQSESGDSSKAILTYGSSNANGTNNCLIQLYGTKYVTFKQLTLSRTGSGVYQSVLELKGGASNNSFLNDRFMGVKLTSANTSADIVVSAADVDTANVFKNNAFKYGNSAVNISGNSGSHETGNVFDGNQIDSCYSTAISLVYNDRATIKNNTITNANFANNSYYGIALSSCNNNSITANKILMPNGAAAGIYLLSSNGTSSAPGTVANNYVSIGTGSYKPYGIKDSSSTYQNFYFNSIDIYKANTGAAFYANAGSGNINVKNNIFYNNGGGYAIVIPGTSSLSSSDYNDLYSKGGTYVGSWGGNPKATFAAWKSASSMDANSVSIDPVFNSNTDYHTRNSFLYGRATPISGLNKDIEGTIRNSSKPDIGALEFQGLAIDAGINYISSPANIICVSTKSVTATIRNNGTTKLTSATINWSVNGTAQTPYSWTGSLNAGDSASVTLGSYSFSSTGTAIVKASTTSPNSKTDSFPANDTFTLKITVNSIPSAKVGSAKTICAGTSTAIGATAVSGNSYSWTSKPSGFTSSSANPTVNPTVTTMYYLTETNPGGCNKSDSVLITVNPLPAVTVGSAKTICSGSSTQIGGSSVSGLAYSWTSNPSGFTSSSANPTVKPAVTTYYILTVTNGSGCSNKDSVKVTINPVPTGAAGTAQTICKGESATIGGKAVTGISYSWTSNPAGFTSTAASPAVSPSVTTTYRVVASNTTGCSDTDSVTVTVNPLPTAFAGTAQTICNGQTITLGTTFVKGYNYIWYSDPPAFSSTAAQPKDAPSTTTRYFVIVTNAQGCKSKDSVLITVNPKPTAVVGSSQAVCNGSSATIGGTAISGQTYSWTSRPSGYTSTSANPTVSPTATTTYILTATNTQGCTATDSVIVYVNPEPSAITGPDRSICAGQSIVLGGKAVPGNLYTWTTIPSGPTYRVSSPTVTPSSTTKYILTETVGTSGCTKTDTVTITVNPLPNAGSLNGPQSVCTGSVTYYKPSNITSGITYTFSVTPTSNASGISTSVYKDSIEIDWGSSGSALVWMYAKNSSGCKDSASVNVTINDLPSAHISANEVCLGQATQFTNLTTGGNRAFWSFGDGDTLTSTASSITHTYAKAGTYRAILLAFNSSNCFDTISQVVKVDALPTVSFSYSGTCQGGATAFTNKSTGSSKVVWDFGDGSATSTVNNPSHTYADTGTYMVKLVASNAGGCSDSFTTKVIIIPSPKATWTVKQQGTTRHYTFTATDTTATSYSWDFGDLSAKGTGKSVVHTYPGNGSYHVVLTVTNSNGCSASTDSLFKVTGTGLKDINADAFNLDIFPNPFNDKTELRYTLGEQSNVSITLMDMTGRKLGNICNTSQPAGSYMYEIDAAANNLKSGVYFVNLLVNGNSITRRIIKVE